MKDKIYDSKSNGAVLVTGASGFIGRHICKTLADAGYRVRAFVRPTSNTDNLTNPNIELSFGDMEDRDSLRTALRDIQFVIHAAADTSGTADGGKHVTVDGTRFLVDLCVKTASRMVYISSCSVYQISGIESGVEITESSELEQDALTRGAYTSAKLQAEKIVTSAMRSETLVATCLRPGFVFGDGGELINPMIGVRVKERLLVALGSPEQELPAVHVTNVASAVLRSIESEIAIGKIYNLIDDEVIRKSRYIDDFVRPRISGLRVIYIPMWLLKPLVAVQEALFKAMRKKPLLTSYRLSSSQNSVHISGDRIRKELNWRGTTAFIDTIAR